MFVEGVDRAEELVGKHATERAVEDAPVVGGMTGRTDRLGDARECLNGGVRHASQIQFDRCC